MSYLKTNISNDRLTEIIKRHIIEKTPLSFTRIGDGEIRFLTDMITPSMAKRVMAHGIYNNLQEATKSGVEIIDRCLRETDIIGIMDQNNEIAKSIDWKEKTWSIKKSYLKEIGRSKPTKVADHMVTRSRSLGDPNEFKKLIEGRGVCIVSPRVDGMKSNNLEKILDAPITYIKTPLGIDMRDKTPLLQELDKIQEDIVLFGCSLRGKDFGIHLRDNGKIALDFGATLDAWSGLESRGWFKKGGLQEYCLIKTDK